MRFACQPVDNRTLGILPLLSVSALPALLVLGIVCSSLSREGQSVRLPGEALPRPPAEGEAPVISLRLSAEGGVTIGGEPTAEGNLATAWQRERAAVRLLGFEPSQAAVVVWAAPELAVERVRHVIEAAQRAGFTRCVFRDAEAAPSSAGRGKQP